LAGGFQKGFLNHIRRIDAALKTMIQAQRNQGAQPLLVSGEQFSPNILFPGRHALQ
jgi:hypothetical protein